MKKTYLFLIIIAFVALFYCYAKNTQNVYSPTNYEEHSESYTCIPSNISGKQIVLEFSEPLWINIPSNRSADDEWIDNVFLEREALYPPSILVFDNNGEAISNSNAWPPKSRVRYERIDNKTAILKFQPLDPSLECYGIILIFNSSERFTGLVVNASTPEEVEDEYSEDGHDMRWMLYSIGIGLSGYIKK